MQSYPVDKRLLFLLAAIVVSSYFALLSEGTVLDRLVREDGLIENIGTAAFFVAAVSFLVAFWQARQQSVHWLKQLAYLALSGLFFVIVGEEISWGQRIFDFATPEGLLEINTQDEFNFHNLEVIQENPLLNTDRLFALFWLGYMVLLPLTAVLHKPFGEWANRWLPVMPLLLGLLFVLNYGVAKVARPAIELSDLYHSIYPVRHSVVELKESLYGLLFAVVGVYAVRFRRGGQ